MILTRLDLPNTFHQSIPCPPRPIPTTASATGGRKSVVRGKTREKAACTLKPNVQAAFLRNI